MSYKLAPYSSDKAFERPDEIFVVFTDLHQHRGRFYGLHSGFGHCFMLFRFGEDWWVVDPLFGGITHARIRHLPRQEMLDLLLSQHCRVVAVREAFGGNRAFGGVLGVQFRMLSFGVFSCVTLVKRCLGIRRPWLITPFGLYKFFIRTKQENY